MGTRLKSLDGADSVVDGAAYGVGSVDRTTISLQVSGMVTNDIVQVEASNEVAPSSDDDWEQVGDDITEDGMYAIETGAEWYRANLTDVSGGGTVTAIFAGGY